MLFRSIDRLHTTARSHARCFVVEVMGRHTGWIAIQAGMAAGAHMILIPEFPKSIEDVIEVVVDRQWREKHYSIIVVAEGFELSGMEQEAIETDDFGNVRLEKKEIGPKIAKMIEAKTGIITRATVLGHLIRGGTPTAFDRVLGTKFGVKAAELAIDKAYGNMVALQGTNIIAADLEKAVTVQKRVDAEFYQNASYFFR